MELFDLPLYAVQRLASGLWLVRSPMGDPILPAVDVVAVVDEQTSAFERAHIENAIGATIRRRRSHLRSLREHSSTANGTN
jgi:hypothetical protein